MKTFWIRFDYDNGKFVEKEFYSDEAFYEFLEWNKGEIKDWKRIEAPNN